MLTLQNLLSVAATSAPLALDAESSRAAGALVGRPIRIDYSRWPTDDLLSEPYAPSVVYELCDRNVPGDVLARYLTTDPSYDMPYGAVAAASAMTGAQVAWVIEHGDIKLVSMVASQERFAFADRHAAILTLALRLGADEATVREAIKSLKAVFPIGKVLRDLERVDVLSHFALKVATYDWDTLTATHLYDRVVRPLLDGTARLPEKAIAGFVRRAALSDDVLADVMAHPRANGPIWDEANAKVDNARLMLTEPASRVFGRLRGQDSAAAVVVSRFLTQLAAQAGSRWSAAAAVLTEMDLSGMSLEQAQAVALDAAE